MGLAFPRLVVLDSATLGKVSADYWSHDTERRNKARTLLKRLQDRGVHVALTFTHVSELLRHGDAAIVRGRLSFLRSIPLIAWLRPYDRNWFLGNNVDLLCRELHAVLHGSARTWRDVIEAVRPDFWETGTGADMFVEDNPIWSLIPRISRDQHESEKHVASVARTDPGNVSNMKLCDVLRLPIRPKEERAAYMRRFAVDLQKQMDRHGDKRFDQSPAVAVAFAKSTLQHIESMEAIEGPLLERMAACRDVPPEFVDPEMTIAELGALAVYAKQLAILHKSIRPTIAVTMTDVPPNTLPSYVLEQRLAGIQRRAERVSGSDLGDGTIAPLVFYADAVEVDKRTGEYLKQIQQSEPQLAKLMGPFFRSPDYSRLPDYFE